MITPVNPFSPLFFSFPPCEVSPYREIGGRNSLLANGTNIPVLLANRGEKKERKQKTERITMGFSLGVFASGHFYHWEDEAKTGKAFFSPVSRFPSSSPHAVLFTELRGDFIS